MNIFFSDCEAFICTFADFFILGMEIPKDFDVEVYRSRLALSLYWYGMRKLHGEIVSESEQTGKIRKKRKLKEKEAEEEVIF